MQELARTEQIEAYSFPAGVLATLFREIGAGRPGVITRVGLGTFADPRVNGGKINASATDDLVEVVSLGGEEYLRYKPFKIDFAIVMASAADEKGNVTTRHEPADLDVYALALAASNSGGKVIVQVKRRIQSGEHISPRQVRIPGVLVSTLVEVPTQPQCQIAEYDPTLSGESRCEISGTEQEAPIVIRRLVAERAARELVPGQSVNFGFGFPGAIPGLLAAEGQEGAYWCTVEQGIHNGNMLDGVMFGAARNADAIVASVDQFDFYSGGGIDITFLGMGEMDAEGNVNVSKLGTTVVGPGGFMDITHGAKKVVFCGAFETKGLEIQEDGENVSIISPGEIPKLVERVRHVTFSGREARKAGKEVLYVTERAVFRLDPEGVRLVEVAPGVDVEKDVLARMGFAPLVDSSLLVNVTN